MHQKSKLHRERKKMMDDGETLLRMIESSRFISRPHHIHCYSEYSDNSNIRKKIPSVDEKKCKHSNEIIKKSCLTT